LVEWVVVAGGAAVGTGCVVGGWIGGVEGDGFGAEVECATTGAEDEGWEAGAVDERGAADVCCDGAGTPADEDGWVPGAGVLPAGAVVWGAPGCPDVAGAPGAVEGSEAAGCAAAESEAAAGYGWCEITVVKTKVASAPAPAVRQVSRDKRFNCQSRRASVARVLLMADSSSDSWLRRC
jgi:hypothetical protein